MRRHLLAAALMLALPGCISIGSPVGPDYSRPDLPQMDKFRGQEETPAPPNPDKATDIASFADLPWWQAFDDPDLATLIGDAIVNGYDAKIAVSRVEQARASLGVTESQFYPQVGYSGAASAGERSYFASPSVSSPNPPSAAYLASGTVAWQIDLWGKIRRQTEQARALLLSSEANQRGVLLTVATSVAQNYYTLLELDLLLQIARDTVAVYTQTYDLFNRRVIGGYASALEAEAAAAQLASVAAQVPQLVQQIAAVENAINVLAGRVPGPVKRGKPLIQLPPPPPVPAGLPSALVERRPDLQAAEQNLHAAVAAIGVADANYYPNISLTGVLGFVSPQLNSLLNGNGNLWGASGGITGPIFTGGLLDSQKKLAVAQAEQARLQFQLSTLNAYQEVSNALANRTAIRDALIQQQRAVVANQSSVRMATDRYVAGVSSYYEVLQQLQNLYPAQIKLAQLQGDRYLNVVQIYLTLGGGWTMKPDQWAGMNAIERQP